MHPHTSDTLNVPACSTGQTLVIDTFEYSSGSDKKFPPDIGGAVPHSE